MKKLILLGIILFAGFVQAEALSFTLTVTKYTCGTGAWDAVPLAIKELNEKAKKICLHRKMIPGLNLTIKNHIGEGDFVPRCDITATKNFTCLE